jgi:hypothetical protein
MAASNGGETQSVMQFIDQIRWLYEPEYGDFKRKVGLYIQRLEEAAPALKKGATCKVLETMKTTVLFDPNGDIESTRRKVLQLAHELTGPGGQTH